MYVLCIKDKFIYIFISNAAGGYDMKENNEYKVEREFLSKFSSEELIKRIIRRHLSFPGDKKAV